MSGAAVWCPSCSSSTAVIGASRYYAMPRALRWLRHVGLPIAWWKHECWDCGASYRAPADAPRRKGRKTARVSMSAPVTLPVPSSVDDIAAVIRAEQRRQGKVAHANVARFAARKTLEHEHAIAVCREAVLHLQGQADA